MPYITKDLYKEYSGIELSDAEFTRLLRKTSAEVDERTFDRLTPLKESELLPPIYIVELFAELITLEHYSAEIEAEKLQNSGRTISSYSNDGVSVSYASSSSDDAAYSSTTAKKKEVRNLIRSYLGRTGLLNSKLPLETVRINLPTLTREYDNAKVVQMRMLPSGDGRRAFWGYFNEYSDVNPPPRRTSDFFYYNMRNTQTTVSSGYLSDGTLHFEKKLTFWIEPRLVYNAEYLDTDPKQNWTDADDYWSKDSTERKKYWTLSMNDLICFADGEEVGIQDIIYPEGSKYQVSHLTPSEFLTKYKGKVYKVESITNKITGIEVVATLC